MNVTPTPITTIEYSLKLSAEDARLALDDPFSFGEKVRDALLPHMPGANGNGNGRKPGPASQIAIGRKRAAKKAPGKRGPKSSAAGKTQYICAECGQAFSREGNLSRHQAKTGHAHRSSTSAPRPASAAAAESSAT